MRFSLQKKKINSNSFPFPSLLPKKEKFSPEFELIKREGKRVYRDRREYREEEEGGGDSWKAPGKYPEWLRLAAPTVGRYSKRG